MGFYRTKEWPLFELSVFKLSCILFGVMVGAYAAPFVRAHLLTFAVITLLGSARVACFYWKN